ncbi:MAG: DUF177 domain-containing protein [Hyphomicrobiales bacterium]|jgi:uncharacterized metal-binding protein YceD (DUF177 family)
MAKNDRTNQTPLPSLTILATEARRSPVRVKLDLSADERAVLADENNLPSVEAFHLKATALGMKGRKLRVEGHLTADVTYQCGVSLKPYQASLDVPFQQHFGEDQRAPDLIDFDPMDDNEIEPLVNGEASISDLGYQLFSLALDPYPRHPDLAPPSEQMDEDGDDELEGQASPFAVLKDLKL